jgi:replicative DNA helicase
LNKELLVINAVLENKDIGTLFANGVDDLMHAYGDVWLSIKAFYTKYHTVPNFATIQGRFEALEYVKTELPTQFYIDQLREDVLSTKLDNLLYAKSADLNNGANSVRVLAELQAEFSKLNRIATVSHDVDISDVEAARKSLDELRARAEARGGQPGIPTGVSFIDASYTAGISPGDFVVLLGFTGRKKSLLATLMACNAFAQGYTPMIVSLEMPVLKVQNRAYTILGSGLFKNSDLELGQYPEKGMKELEAKMDGHNNKFHVVSNDTLGTMTPNVVRGKIDRYQPDFVVFDYCQLGSDNAQSGDMTSKMRNMSNEFKTIAVQDEIGVLAISSATPENGTAVDGPPMVEQVAYSKQLAYDSDLAIAVHGYDESNLVDVVGRKNRNGPLFSGSIDWDVNNGIYQEVF